MGSVKVLPALPDRPFLRRLSSMTTTEDEVKEGGPVVIVPERMMRKNQKQNGCSIAAAIETARKELSNLNIEEEDSISSTSSSKSLPGSPDFPAKISTADSFAFAFDIDGVLIRGGRPIPEAIEAMRVLNGENKYGIKVPYIFLTNGGGKTESERCIDLSRQLDIEVSPSQFICGKLQIPLVLAIS
ncbi:putative phosphatidyl synthase [Erysiphe necator]|uniref:Putative phosphatidyl synthase n=1 Tax=Uncinula necator TaxID=52586 RepID=A0A0B1P2Z1_UNCNE|nr:putative phosphatidyl synthase [Erysiphe necator]